MAEVIEHYQKLPKVCEHNKWRYEKLYLLNTYLFDFLQNYGIPLTLYLLSKSSQNREMPEYTHYRMYMIWVMEVVLLWIAVFLAEKKSPPFAELICGKTKLTKQQNRFSFRIIFNFSSFVKI